MITPRRIEYTGPGGWRVVTDEDGVHIRTPKGDALEQREVGRLVEIFTAAAEQHNSGDVPIPAPPTRDEAAALLFNERNRYAMQRATRAIRNEFNPDVPF